jgi:signal transduction histidine kinase/CheY-like chemotaxis protein/AraC-like DNA-binding protein
MSIKSCLPVLCCLLFRMALPAQSGLGQASNATGTDTAASVFVLTKAIHYELRQHVGILPDTAPGYGIAAILQPRLQARFQPYAGQAKQIASFQPYWGKLQLENRLPNAADNLEWVLQFSGTFTHLEIFTKDTLGNWVAEANGSFLPLYQKKFAPTRSGNYVKLALPPHEPVTVYFRGIGERNAVPPSFQIFVQPAGAYYDQLLNKKTWSALFSGFLLMMLLYNFIKFFIVKDRSYFYYSGYLFMVLVYTAYVSDDLEDWVGGFVFAEHPGYFSLFKTTVYLGLMCWLAFIRSFLDLEHLLPKWDRYFRWLIWLGPPLLAVFIFLAFRYNFSYVIDDRTTLFYIALVTISGFLFIYPLYKTKDPKGYFIAAGIGVISLGFLLTLFSRLDLTAYTVDNLKVCTIIEILIFSMGLAYRQKKQVEDKQQADFALRESRLLQEKNQVEADRLQELNDFKGHFFTNITHEFRTPLTVILGMGEQTKAEIEKLEIGKLKPEHGGGSISNFQFLISNMGLIRRNGESLLRLINQLLDLAKLESKTLKINYVQGDVLPYLRYISESLHSYANAQNVMLRVESDQAGIVMDYDPERLLQIVHNLLSNAIKFTPSGGKVVLRLTMDDGRQTERPSTVSRPPSAVITVTDTGAGIPPEDLPNIFDRFFQASNLEKAKAGGTGIGLALTKELVQAMGGEINVESEVGKGAVFTVRLPITIKAAASAGVTWNVPKSGGDFKLPPDLPHKSPLDLLPAADDSQSILIIEDNPDVVEYLAACLTSHPAPLLAGEGPGVRYALDFAYNGRAGIEKALETIPDLIVSDVMMPEKDGFEVVEALKNDERTSHIPIILLTAKADVESRLKGLRRGADAYLSKPFHQEELLVTVANLLEMRRKLQERFRIGDYGLRIGEVPENSEIENPQSEIEDVFLQKFRSVVEANLSDLDFEMPQLERALAMSRSQIFRKVKALTGKSPSLFIRCIRLHHGRHLLQTTTLTVSEIAYEVGYSALNNFSDAFFEEFGERPTGMRRKD